MQNAHRPLRSPHPVFPDLLDQIELDRRPRPDRRWFTGAATYGAQLLLRLKASRS